MRGIEKGCYTLPGPDVGLYVHTRLVEGLVPKSLLGGLLDSVLGLLGPTLQGLHGIIFDRISRKAAPRRFGGLWTQGTTAAAPGK